MQEPPIEPPHLPGVTQLVLSLAHVVRGVVMALVAGLDTYALGDYRDVAY